MYRRAQGPQPTGGENKALLVIYMTHVRQIALEL